MLELRKVILPQDVAGELYLSMMPGRTEAFSVAREIIASAGVDTVLCLTSLEEAERRSEGYAEAIKSGDHPWRQWMFPISDLGVPENKPDYLAQIRQAVEHLRGGGKLLVHCYAGVGRTGMTCACILIALGVKHDEAIRLTAVAGAGAEDRSQQGLIRWVQRQLAANQS
jgi:hypothetical protein